MDVKEAVQAAKKHVAEIFADESIANVGLEEVEFNEIEQVWAITIGFSRFWGHPGDIVRALDGDGRAYLSRPCESMTRAVVSGPSSIAMSRELVSPCRAPCLSTRTSSSCSSSAWSVAI